MAIAHLKSKRQSTGAILNKSRKKKKKDFGTDFYPIRVGEERKKTLRTLGGNKKHRLLEAEKANVIGADGKGKVVKILSVKENKSNIHFVRMNVITKGAVIETEDGLAKVTSRPGQDGIINAILIK